VKTTVTEINSGVYRLSTHVQDIDFTFNQFLLDADEPLLFHAGLRQLFPLVSEAVATVMPVDRLRWISFGHVEADECGSMNQWLAAAPQAQVVHGTLGVMVSLNDLADRPPRALAEGEVLDLGGHRVRWIDTPHVPHAWEAGLMYEEATGTLLCGDLFTHTGNPEPLTTNDIVGPADAAEDLFRATCLTPATAPTIRRLAELSPTTLALMHGSSFAGDCGHALRDLADLYDGRLRAALTAAP
jgi:flavorubredoxin